VGRKLGKMWWGILLGEGESWVCEWVKTNKVEGETFAFQVFLASSLIIYFKV